MQTRWQNVSLLKRRKLHIKFASDAYKCALMASRHFTEDFETPNLRVNEEDKGGNDGSDTDSTASSYSYSGSGFSE